MLIKAWLLLSLFVILGSSAPTQLLRQRRQEEQEQEATTQGGGLIGSGPSLGKTLDCRYSIEIFRIYLGFFRSQLSGIAGLNSLTASQGPFRIPTTTTRPKPKRFCRNRRGRLIRCRSG